MPAPKKGASAPAPTTPAPAETSGASAPTPVVEPVPALPVPAEAVAEGPADASPPVPLDDAEEHDNGLSKLATDDEDDAPEALAPEPTPALSSLPSAPPEEPVENEIDRLRREMAEMKFAHEREMQRVRDLAIEESESRAHKPAPPPPPAFSSPRAPDPLREAKAFGVLATWNGPGTYGGPYYTLRGDRMPQATGLTTGYFPRACVEKFVDQFTKVQ